MTPSRACQATASLDHLLSFCSPSLLHLGPDGPRNYLQQNPLLLTRDPVCIASLSPREIQVSRKGGFPVKVLRDTRGLLLPTAGQAPQ